MNRAELSSSSSSSSSSSFRANPSNTMESVYQEESSIRANRLKEEAHTLRRIGTMLGTLISVLVVCVFGVDADLLEEILGALSMNVFAATILVLTCQSIAYVASLLRNSNNYSNRNSHNYNDNYNDNYKSTRTPTRTRRSLHSPGTPASILRRRKVVVPSTISSPLVGVVTPRRSSLLVGFKSKTGRRSPIPNSVSVLFQRKRASRTLPLSPPPLVGGPFRR